MKILSDILDAYFPYVLKSKFPNGVFLNVIDHTADLFDESKDTDGKKGQLIGGSEKKINSQKSIKENGVRFQEKTEEENNEKVT